MEVLFANFSFMRIVLGGMLRMVMAVQGQQQTVRHHSPHEKQQ